MDESQKYLQDKRKSSCVAMARWIEQKNVMTAIPTMATAVVPAVHGKYDSVMDLLSHLQSYLQDKISPSRVADIAFLDIP